MLNLEQVETFLVVIEEGGFREAARRLNTSQPTITQHIKKLEAALGAQLVKRSHALCEPTSYGERFAPFARRLLEAEERARSAVKDDPFHIGASRNIGTYLLPSRLKGFLDLQKEKVQFSVSLDSNPRIAERLARGELSIGLMEWWEDTPGFRAEIWRKERLVVIVPPDHPWADRRSVPKRLLFSAPMIGGEPGTGTARRLTEALGEAASEIKLSMSLGSTEAVKQAVMAGMGVSIVVESAVREQVGAGSLCALPIAGTKLGKDLFAVLPDDTSPASKAKAFAGYLSAKP